MDNNAAVQTERSAVEAIAAVFDTEWLADPRIIAERIYREHIAPLVQERDELRDVYAEDIRRVLSDGQKRIAELERERDERTKDASQWEETAEALQTERDELVRQRDEARQGLSEAFRHAGLANLRCAELERQVARLERELAETRAGR